MVLVQKRVFFQLFFQGIQARKMIFMIFLTEKTPFQAIKTRSSKNRQIDIFPKGLTHSFGPKMAIFPRFFFRQHGRGKCLFMIFLNEKTPFQTIKTRSSKSQKFDIFPKGFGPKMAFFPTFFLRNIDQDNLFYDILERKTPFQAKKTRSSKSRNIDIFPKGLTHDFGQKIAIFFNVFFYAIEAGK